MKNEFWPELEVHTVVVVPLSAPDKPISLEGVDDFTGDAVLVLHNLTWGGARPFPVLTELCVDIDCDAEAVAAQPNLCRRFGAN